ncbi:hypothetical protein VTK26DRAFT_5993 [Humicola hyalothermophila]
MSKFLALILAAAAAVMVQAQCPANTRLCGSDILNTYQCATELSLTFITPEGNSPYDCHFRTNEAGEPQAMGAACCAAGRCANGECWPWYPNCTYPNCTYPPSLKMSCSQLVVERLDPLVSPGAVGSHHVHQIVGGDSFNATMDPSTDPAELSTCTTCTFTDDFSNYWSPSMYFRARNGTYKRVKQLGALFHENARGGGITIYYFSPNYGPPNITAFRQGFRMRSGHPDAKGPNEDIYFTCLITDSTRYTNMSYTFPAQMCPEGILTHIYFPSCWDGVNLDSPDHTSHVAYPAKGDFGRLEEPPCPASHPVRIPRILLEARWDTREFNKPELWPEDGSQPFVWSFGDNVGYGQHGDYIFGWRGDSLQKAFDSVDCVNQLCGLPTQMIEEANECRKEPIVDEDVDGWLEELPGGPPRPGTPTAR